MILSLYVFLSLSRHMRTFYLEREKEMKLRHARPPALRWNFSLNLVSDGDEGCGRTSDRIFPFYLPVQGQSISLVYYMVNILERRKKFWRRDTKRRHIACV